MNARPFPWKRPFCRGLPLGTHSRSSSHVQTVVFGFPFPTYHEKTDDRPIHRSTDSSFRFRVSVSASYLFGTTERARACSAWRPLTSFKTTKIRFVVPTYPPPPPPPPLTAALPSAPLMIFVISSFCAPSPSLPLSLSLAVGRECNRNIKAASSMMMR